MKEKAWPGQGQGAPLQIRTYNLSFRLWVYSAAGTRTELYRGPVEVLPLVEGMGEQEQGEEEEEAEVAAAPPPSKAKGKGSRPHAPSSPSPHAQPAKKARRGMS